MMASNKIGVLLLLGFLVLVMFCSPGDALKCLYCESPSPSCNKNITCRPEDDACLRLASGGTYYYSCWKYANCNIEHIGQTYPTANAQYYCCQRDLCNAAGMGATVSKTAMMAGFLVLVGGSLHI